MKKIKEILGTVIAVALIGGILWFGSATALLRAAVGLFWRSAPQQNQTTKELPPMSADELDVYSRIWAKVLKEPLTESDIGVLENTYRSYLTRLGLNHFSTEQAKYLSDSLKIDYDYNHELENCLLLSSTFHSPNITPEFKRWSAQLIETGDEGKEQVESETNWIKATANGEKWTDREGQVHDVMTREKALQKLHDLELVAPNFDRLSEMFQRLAK